MPVYRSEDNFMELVVFPGGSESQIQVARLSGKHLHLP